jgi:hypothetical protein
MLTMAPLKARAFAFAIVLACAFSCCPAVGKDYRLCIGEFDEKCPVSHNVWAGCGANPDTVADNTCAVTVGGQKKLIPHRLIHQGSHDGNRCGYEWYSIECMDQGAPGTPQ